MKTILLIPLLFLTSCAATKDPEIRAFARQTGKQVVGIGLRLAGSYLNSLLPGNK
jgi:hypothetical protein